MKRKVYMSFGGGVQSTAIAMLSLNKDPRLLEVSDGRVPEMYIFADTGDERRITYQHVWEMSERFEKANIAFLVFHRPQSLSEHIIERALTGKSGGNTLPFWIEARDGSSAPVRRGCTSHYKIELLDQNAKKYWNVRRKRGVKGGYLEEPVQQWLGISYDEMQRMKISQVQWRNFFYPLIEMRWTRSHCLEYLQGLGVRSVRSSCVYCPFHNPKEWGHIKNDKHAWEVVLKVDQALEIGFKEHKRVGGLKTRPYLHKKRIPIDQVDFEEKQLDLFGGFDNECFGVCGV